MLIPSLEFLGGIVVGGLLAMLPLTPTIYVILSVLLLGVVAHMSWRIAKLAKITANRMRFVFSAFLTLVLAAILAWGYSIRFSKDAAAQGIQGDCNNYGANGTIIGSCNKTIIAPPPENDTLYQGLRPVGRIAGISVDQTQKKILIATISANREIDFSQEMLLQKKRFLCHWNGNRPGFMRFGAQATLTYRDTICEYLGDSE